MKMCNKLQISGHRRNNVALHDLLVIYIVYHLDKRTVRFADHVKRLRRACQIIARMIHKRVERLDHERHTIAFQNRHSRAQRRNNALMLKRTLRTGVRTYLRDELGGTDTLCRFTALTERGKIHLSVFGRSHVELRRAHADKLHTGLFADRAYLVQLQILPTVGFSRIKAERCDLAKRVAKIKFSEKTRNRNTKTHFIHPFRCFGFPCFIINRISAKVK